MLILIFLSFGICFYVLLTYRLSLCSLEWILGLSCLSLSGAVIMGVCYHIQLMFLYQSNAALLGNNGEAICLVYQWRGYYKWQL